MRQTHGTYTLKTFQSKHGKICRFVQFARDLPFLQLLMIYHKMWYVLCEMSYVFPTEIQIAVQCSNLDVMGESLLPSRYWLPITFSHFLGESLFAWRICYYFSLNNEWWSFFSLVCYDRGSHYSLLQQT